MGIPIKYFLLGGAVAGNVAVIQGAVAGSVAVIQEATSKPPEPRNERERIANEAFREICAAEGLDCSDYYIKDKNGNGLPEKNEIKKCGWTDKALNFFGDSTIKKISEKSTHKHPVIRKVYKQLHPYLGEVSQYQIDLWKDELENTTDPERRVELINTLAGADIARVVDESIYSVVHYVPNEYVISSHAIPAFTDLQQMEQTIFDLFELEDADRAVIHEMVLTGTRAIYEVVKSKSELHYNESFNTEEFINKLTSTSDRANLVEALKRPDLEILKPPFFKTFFPAGGLLPQECGFSDKDVPALEKIMRPEMASDAGFLGPNESLMEVMLEDRKTLEKYAITHLEIADLLEQVLGKKRVYHRKIRVGNETYLVKGLCTMGSQICPICEDYARGSCNYNITKLSTGEQFQVGELLIHLIRKHQFFEGKGTSYRLDPETFIKFFGMDKGKCSVTVLEER